LKGIKRTARGSEEEDAEDENHKTRRTKKARTLPSDSRHTDDEEKQPSRRGRSSMKESVLRAQRTVNTKGREAESEQESGVEEIGTGWEGDVDTGHVSEAQTEDSEPDEGRRKRRRVTAPETSLRNEGTKKVQRNTI
jgi:hypothetical protein